MIFQGHYFDGQSPLQHAVTVTRQGDQWSVRGDGVEFSWSHDDLRIEWMFQELHLTRPAHLDHIVLQGLTKADLIALGLRKQGRSSQQKAVFALSLAAGTVGLFLAIYASLNPLSYFLAQQIPAESERAIFDHITPVRVLEHSRCQQWDAQAMLQGLGDQLKEVGDPALTYEILDWDMANAFAFPGRRIYVTQGLLDKVGSSEELLAVLSHEKGHVDLRHNVGATIYGLMSAFVWSVAVGDFSGAFIVDPKLVKNMSDSSYSREKESDADKYGAEKLSMRGYDPKALGRALVAISKDKEETDVKDQSKWKKWKTKIGSVLQAWNRLISSHPETDDRGAVLARLYPTNATREALKADQWDFLKKACVSKAKHSWDF